MSDVAEHDHSTVLLHGCETLSKQLGTRLSVCDGIFMSRGIKHRAPLPLDEWRSLNAEELQRLVSCGRGPETLDRTIGLFELSTRALGRITEFLEWYFLLPTRNIEDSRIEECKIGLLSSIYRRNDVEAIFMGVASGPPNRKTVAVHRNTKDPVGLHLDNYDNLPIVDRPQARNRICVNVGSEPRYLLFLPLQAMALLARITAYDVVNDELKMRASNDHRVLVHEYFNLFPRSKIYRIEIKPGEGYIAPTENIVHEGSTLGMQRRDYSLVWLGRFLWSSLITSV